MFFQEERIKENPLILIVEDDRNNVQVLGSILARKDYDIAVAFEGKSALRMLEQHLPDLILLDVLMPEIDGYDVCRQIRSCTRYNNIPIIFITAKAEEQDIVQGFENGAVDYITKPFHSGELLARVKTHLELKKAREELYEMTIIDELTGLYNRRHIKTELEHEWHRACRYGLQFTIALFDLDDFKQINDTHGHSVGDSALVHFSDVAQQKIRKTDTLGRIGGEEFCLILPETNIKEASIVAERIRKALETTTKKKESKIPFFTVSVGLAGRKKEDKEDMALDHLLDKADKALYKAKSQGKNKVVV